MIFVLFSRTLEASGNNGYTITKIEDGDTLVAIIDEKPQRLQLIGIDAPENLKNAKLKLDISRTGLKSATLIEIGNAAAQHLRTLIKSGDKIILQGNLKKRDRHGRIPVIAINTQRRVLNKAMIADGYARVLTRHHLEKNFKAGLLQDEASAIKKNLGLWSSHPETVQAWNGRGNNRMNNAACRRSPVDFNFNIRLAVSPDFSQTPHYISLYVIGTVNFQEWRLISSGKGKSPDTDLTASSAALSNAELPEAF